MVEMLGVLILALGLPALFHSLDEGEHVDNGVVVAGYVVMRVATIALWLRAAKHDTARRRTALTYVVFVSITQLGWIVLIFVNLPLAPTLAFTLLLIALELVGPYVAEHGREGGTPWHAHHIAERYGLLVIITLGEIILGTILAISAVIDEQGWSVETVARRVRRHGARVRAVVGVLHHAVGQGARSGTASAASCGATSTTSSSSRSPAPGAGLHVAAYEIEGVAHIGIVQALLTVVVPVGDLHGRAVHDLLAAAAAVRPVPHLAVHRQRRRRSCSRWPPWRPARASGSAS